jgi:hypothetical protein
MPVTARQKLFAFRHTNNGSCVGICVSVITEVLTHLGSTAHRVIAISIWFVSGFGGESYMKETEQQHGRGMPKIVASLWKV